MALKTADGREIIWADPHDEPFDLAGFAWIEKDTVYRRLPLVPAWDIRAEVDELANHTAGGQTRFKTDSRKIWIKAELRGPSGMYHMPATGQSGFDLYQLQGQGYRYIKTARFSPDTTAYEAEMFSQDEKKMNQFILNFPLYNGVKAVEVGLESGALVEAPPAFSHEGKIVIYGTSITQGGCVSRPGMAYSNILSRMLDVEFINLGFSGNGRGEPELARLICQIPDIRLIILDYEANANETIHQTLGSFIDILRETFAEVPVLVVSKIRYATATEGSPAYDLLIRNRDFQKSLVLQRNNEGDKNLFFLDGSSFLGEDYDECTVDGSHPSDLGSHRIAAALLTAIEDIMRYRTFRNKLYENLKENSAHDKN
ncbi:MAG: SGNH/GDSL hydrolase family protein [Cyclobacteriaceae bacterium]|nr:SGNH/GDSL hydrolase family protein [Cyclobacteriaceae bacterium]